DPDRVEADRDLLRRFYLRHGYADMRVTSASAQYDPEHKGFTVTFSLEEGSRYRIGTVDVRSELAAVDAPALRARLRTQPGDIDDADAVAKTVEDLVIELGRHGEPFAAVRPRAEPAPDRAVMNVVYVIEPGGRRYVERIEIRGNRKTVDGVVRREFDLAEGDAYNRALVERAKRRLEKLGYFKTVKIAEQPGSAPDRVVLAVTVEEQETGDFRWSGGYSTSDGLVGQVSISERNLLGQGLLAKASVVYGEYTRGFDLAVSKPYVLDNGTSLGLDLFGKETLASSYQSYASTTYGATLAAGTPVSEEVGTQLRYSLYNQSVTLDPSKGVAS